MSIRICIEKESIKFSCSHFTIFGPLEAEALHGHNYYVTAEFGLREIDPHLGMAFDFNLLKPLLKEEVDKLDERVLIPKNSPFLKVEKTFDQIKVSHGKKSYAFPKEDVLELDTVNITSEELARDFAKRIQSRLSEHKEFARISSLTIGIQETRGQTVFYDMKLELA
jgi:6-pyruvoyltetrahydropterin/6-carboxytetrahydropterin synthase